MAPWPVPAFLASILFRKVRGPRRGRDPSKPQETAEGRTVSCYSTSCYESIIHPLSRPGPGGHRSWRLCDAPPAPHAPPGNG
jgi:hypothetical protein